MNFREGTVDDAEAIAALHADSWRRAYRGMYSDEFLDGDLLGERSAVWLERLERPSPSQVVILGVEGNELAGFVCGYGGDDAVWGSLIDNLHVNHRFRRRGVGAALMARVAEAFEGSHPDAGVYLWVFEANHGAREFYERLGAANAETVPSEFHAAHGGPVCRYVWPSPSAFAGT